MLAPLLLAASLAASPSSAAAVLANRTAFNRPCVDFVSTAPERLAAEASGALRLLGFEDDVEVVGDAANGVTALELAARLLPDVVLMDINMPELDGIAATERLTALLPSASVVMMSVQGEPDVLRRAMLAGAREFLVKPFSSDELVTSIRQVHAREREKLDRLSPVGAQAPSAPSPARTAELRSLFAGEPEFGEYGQCVGYTGIVQDVTERHQAEDSIRKLANKDPLTQLPNRRQFNWRAERALEQARRMGHKMALLLIDRLLGRGTTPLRLADSLRAAEEARKPRVPRSAR